MKRAVSTLLLAALLATPARAQQAPLVCERQHASAKRLAIVGAATVDVGVVVRLVAKHRKHAAAKVAKRQP